MPRVHKGRPIPTLLEKVSALTYCLSRPNHEEDAAGHLCDLLEYCRQRIHPSNVEVSLPDLEAMVKYYGKDLLPIDTNPG